MTPNYWQQLQQAYRSRQIIWLISGLVVCTVIWAKVATLDEVVVGQGTLVPSASVQKVQSLDGGILTNILVAEGDNVKLGQQLVTLDATRASANFAEAKAEQGALLRKQIQYTTLIEAIHHNRINSDLSFEHLPPADQQAVLAKINEIKSRADSANERTIQKQKQWAESNQNTQTLRHSLTLLKQELELTQDAVDSGALSAAELRKLERERVNLSGQLEAEYINNKKLHSQVIESQTSRELIFDEFRAETLDQLASVETQIARIEQVLKGLDNQLQQTRLFASMDGIVKSITLPSIGGVVKPGDTIMEIVPTNDTLVVESKIAPQDIAHLKVGQPAVIKFSAYDFVIFGGLAGKLVTISPDAITNDRGESYFIAHVQADSESNHAKPLIPGMQAQVDILAGKKTVMDYWLKPLLRARANAMREP